MTTLQEHKPYRIVVFASGLRRGRARRQFTELIPYDYAYVLWNPDQPYGLQARLSGAGCFEWPGMWAAKRAVDRVLADTYVRQVSVRTNQDKQVYRYFRHSDGRITGYYGSGD